MKTARTARIALGLDLSIATPEEAVILQMNRTSEELAAAISAFVHDQAKIQIAAAAALEGLSVVDIADREAA